MDYFTQNLLSLDYECKIHQENKKRKDRNYGKNDKWNWIFNYPEYGFQLENMVMIETGKKRVEIRPMIDCFCDGRNNIFDLFIDDKQDFFNKKFDNGYNGRQWRETPVWVNAPYEPVIMEKAINYMKKRRMMGLFLGPIGINVKSGMNWDKTDYVRMAREYCNNIFMVFKREQYNDLFSPGFSMGNFINSPPFDVCAFWLDFTRNYFVSNE